MFVISCVQSLGELGRKSHSGSNIPLLWATILLKVDLSSGMISTALHVSDANLMTLQSTQLFLLLVSDKMY